ncbi:hypothetical protein JS756_09145 [Streptomyces actuosus]|uniref:TrwC relaxase domain-containing protein n=1 Tax=Streptomyces actuosus TaxID=1885 RepID=A0ABS2VMD8_STRAS|nr:hypothetical protein [Streptomyces actuosus]MBN0044273.1 hypothetical protein [Streptomyces actuosus]
MTRSSANWAVAAIAGLATYTDRTVEQVADVYETALTEAAHAGEGQARPAIGRAGGPTEWGVVSSLGATSPPERDGRRGS